MSRLPKVCCFRVATPRNGVINVHKPSEDGDYLLYPDLLAEVARKAMT